MTINERPILFSGEMVRALLAGTKTQTRRVVKPQPYESARITVGHFHPAVIDRDGEEQPGEEIFGAYCDTGEWGAKLPYGVPGDKLWVRETWMPHRVPGKYRSKVGVRFPDGAFIEDERANKLWTIERAQRWRPSIHMPRWASRITLEITGVRVERVQSISDADVRAEGVIANRGDGETWYEGKHQDIFERVWERINGKTHPWASNPWVWVVEFRVNPSPRPDRGMSQE